MNGRKGKIFVAFADKKKIRLELGAGGGLVGLAVARGCIGSTLLLTDQEEMMELMQRNIQLNQVESRVKALVLNW